MVDDTMSDEQLVEAMRNTFARLDEWRRLGAEWNGPISGSDLAADDRVWTYSPPSSLALLGLNAAHEHLHAIRLLVNAGELFPSATSTLARTGLIGAALAVWILKPHEPDDRRRRALSLARYDYEEHQKFARQIMREFPPDLVRPSAAAQLARLAERQSQVEALLEPLGGPHQINLTTIVLPAALECISDETVRAQIAGRWRTMSGSVHALLWQHFGHDGTVATDLDEAGIGRVTVGGDVGRLVMDYFSVYHLAVAGWKLFIARSGLDPGPTN